MIGRVVLVLIGAALVAEGVLVEAKSESEFRAMAADPVCRPALTLATPRRRGPTCAVERATIVRAYTDDDRKSPTRHVVVATARTPAWDLRFVAGSGLPDARPGDPAAVETVRGGAAFIATRGGTASLSNDPNGSRNFHVVLYGMATVPFAFALFVRTRRRGREG